MRKEELIQLDTLLDSVKDYFEGKLDWNVPDFSALYEDKAPWDIGHPNKEYVRLEEAGEIVGSVLDVGCGTGENALFLAAQGHEVWGVDFTPMAINKAREKARKRNLNVTFLIRNALELRTLEGHSTPSST